MQYKKIEIFWNSHLCFGGDANFPYNLSKKYKVLEIGCGGGMDAERFVSAGAIYTGIDLTDRAVKITKSKIQDKGEVLKMNAEHLEFPDESFDIVYSFGVIHHAINPENIVKEIHRVLKPGGLFSIMLYNKYSFRYLIEILILRKILWFLHYHKYSEIRKLIPNPTKTEWLSINTDDIGCPMSRVYTKKSALKLMKDFRDFKTFTTNKNWFRIITGRK